jgi:hypothetical protein
MMDSGYDINPKQAATIAVLAACSFQPGSFDKRFSRDVLARVQSDRPLTEKQYLCLRKLLFKYRRQMWNASKYQAEQTIDRLFPVEASIATETSK